MAAGATVVQYGALTIYNCITRQVQQEQVRDDSKSDLLYSKFTVIVTGYVYGSMDTSGAVTSFGIYPNYPAASAAAGSKYVRWLLPPRQSFRMSMGVTVDSAGNALTPGTILLQCDPMTNPADQKTLSNFDVNNGPFCNRFDIIKVVADQIFKVEAEFEISKVECDGLGNSFYNNSGVLNNRWSCIDVVDSDFLTTRTFSGKLRAAGSVVNANSFRSLCLPPMQPGMFRDSMRFQVSESGLELIYTVTDKEVPFAAPAPATKWRFEHTAGRSLYDLGCVTQDVRVWLQGDRYVDKKKLLALAAAIAEAKLLDPKNAGNTCVIQEISITDYYGNDVPNMVSLVARGKIFPTDHGAVIGLPQAKLGVPINAADLAKVIVNYQPNFSRGGRQGEQLEVAGPISMVGAFAAFLQAPCYGNHEMWKSKESQKADSPTPGPTTNIQATQSDDIPSDGTLAYLNQSGSEAIYTAYQMESRYETTMMRAHCPVAIGDTSGHSSSTQDTSAVVTLAPSTTKRRVRIMSERVGKMPDVPSIDDVFTDVNGITYTLLDMVERNIVPDRTPDAKQEFQLDREYVYAMSRTPKSNESVLIGVNPWENAPVYTKTFDSGVSEQRYPLV